MQDGDSKGTVVIFKTPSGAIIRDPYYTLLREEGYNVQIIPLLKEEFQLGELCRVISDGGDQWAGVIISSKRGAEAWVKAASTVNKQLNGDIKACDWSKTPLFTVGSTSISLLRDSQLPIDLSPDLRDVKSAKTANLSFGFILEHHSEQSSTSGGKYLIVRGDKTTNDLQEALISNDIPFEEIVVYKTSPSPDLRSMINQTFGDIASKQSQEYIWLAFFSPSSAEYCLPHLKPLLEDPRLRIRVATIGETTSSFLRSRDLDVNAVALEPTAEGLLKAVLEAG